MISIQYRPYCHLSLDLRALSFFARSTRSHAHGLAVPLSSLHLRGSSRKLLSGTQVSTDERGSHLVSPYLFEQVLPM